MRKFKIGRNGELMINLCPKGFKNVKACRDCEDLLTAITFYGDVRKILCRGSGIDGYSRTTKK